MCPIHFIYPFLTELFLLKSLPALLHLLYSCPANFLHSSPCSHFEGLQPLYFLFLMVHVSDPYSMTLLHISVFIIHFSDSCTVFLSVVLSSLRVPLSFNLLL